MPGGVSNPAAGGLLPTPISLRAKLPLRAQRWTHLSLLAVAVLFQGRSSTVPACAAFTKSASG